MKNIKHILLIIVCFAITICATVPKDNLNIKEPNYWKNYVYETDADAIEKELKQATFKSRGLTLSLKYFENDKNAHNILVIPGTGCYSLFYAELLYNLHLRSYNAFGIDFQGHGDSEGERGDFNINELVINSKDAVEYISKNFNDRIGVVGFSLGGFVAFYTALANVPIKSVVCKNPGIFTERDFQKAVYKNSKFTIFMGKILAKLFPMKKVKTSWSVDFKELAYTEREKQNVEKYLKDPNIVKEYTLRGVISQLSTAPPNPIEELKIPTMFLVPENDRLMPKSYLKDLYNRLPVKKRFVEIKGGGHYVNISNPKETVDAICDCFDETL